MKIDCQGRIIDTLSLLIKGGLPYIAPALVIRNMVHEYIKLTGFFIQCGFNFIGWPCGYNYITAESSRHIMINKSIIQQVFEHLGDRSYAKGGTHYPVLFLCFR